MLYIKYSFSSLYYNNTKVTVDNEIETTTEQTTEQITDKQAEEHFNITKHLAIEENHYKTWDEFYQSQAVWDTLRRRPRLKDWIDYKHSKLTITRDVIYA